MNILIGILTIFATGGCSLLVVSYMLYDASDDIPGWHAASIGICTSVGSLAIPAMALKFIIDLF